AAAEPWSEAARALRVLRDSGELRCAQALPGQGGLGVAQVARPPLATRPDELGAHAPAAGAVPAAAAASRAPAPPPARSESVTRRAGCGKSARPDLWGAGDCNLPGLPDCDDGVLLRSR